MRDLILLAALLAAVPMIFRAPQIGILTWIWITLLNPQQEVYGFLSAFQLNLYIAILTAVAWVFSRERKTAPLNPITLFLVLFGLWASVTTYYALQRDFSYVLWDRTIKTLILALAILAIANNKARIHAIIWMVVLSLGYYGVKGGGFVLVTGGGNHVFGPQSSMIADNNNLGLALVMILPFMNYLRITSGVRWVRWALLAAIFLTMLAIVGTYSRGAIFALVVTGIAYAVRSRSGIIPLVLGGLILTSLPSIVPSNWFERMSTINSYSADSSFEGRVRAWQTSINIAKARITGGGFSSVDLNWVSQAFRTAGSSVQGRAAHSIYFQVLGDHGFIGLVLYLLILAAAWYNTSAVILAARDRPEMEWAARLARTTQVSMIGYLVGGALLSMAYYDGFIILLTMSGALLLYVKQPLGNQAKSAFVPLWRRPTEQDIGALAELPGGSADLRLR
ncbi:MAG TPA: putative O-glycosylation ligase, exosortase A system-associated [Rhizomicrobium sp.]|nr:putative O-glycosylation ligase, exosortase A system-associated [Rhizomicrobium sp.]